MDVDDSKTSNQDQIKKTLKRKRPSLVLESLTVEQKETQINVLNHEIEALFGFYREMKSGFEISLSECSSVNSMVAVLMEEQGLPLSKLVDEIYAKVKEKIPSVTAATVKSSVVFVGQRFSYGVPNDDADVLEDDTHSCLWCWETRDLKLMPKAIRGALKIRRTCRKKIHERITAVSEMIAALRRSESDKASRNDLVKASEKLGKVICEADIRILLENMLQKNGADVAAMEVKREEKKRIKQMEINKRETEKENRRIERKLQNERLQSEKMKQQEAEKDEKRREKEESETKKQLKKQQDEAEKMQRRREKEQTEHKKQLAVQKQASIMESFLKRSKTIPATQNELLSSKPEASDLSAKKSKTKADTVTEIMDRAFSSTSEINLDDLRKSHLSSWHILGQSIRSNPKQRWGMRSKPRKELFKQLKLVDDMNTEKLVDGWGEKTSNGTSCFTTSEMSLPSVKKSKQRRQLLQFDKTNRPAFYGIWPKQSQVVRPRLPLVMDPDLDYDVDSDDEWEEEEPGESLSDCDKDEDEGLEEGFSKVDDEDDSDEDGFFVPDGYLSENEGVQVDRMECDPRVEETRSSPNNKEDTQNEEFQALIRHQKYMHKLTENALRKNQPFIILNLMHQMSSVLVTEDENGTPNTEKTCLQALRICAFPGVPPVEISIENTQDEVQDVSPSNGKGAPPPTLPPIQDSDLPAMVSIIQSCPQGINKVVKMLLQKFPDVSKSQLKNKVREISDFSDNRWQVRRDVLIKLGLSSPPEKSARRTKTIASFFSKRCLPPSLKSGSSSLNESPEQASMKRSKVEEEQVECTGTV